MGLKAVIEGIFTTSGISRGTAEAKRELSSFATQASDTLGKIGNHPGIKQATADLSSWLDHLAAGEELLHRLEKAQSRAGGGTGVADATAGKTREQIAALTVLTDRLKDAEKAQQYLRLAMDVSAGSGEGAAKAAGLVADAYQGMVRNVLQATRGSDQLADKLWLVEGSSKAAKVAMEELNKEFGGEASAAAERTKGRMDSISASVSMIQDKVTNWFNAQELVRASLAATDEILARIAGRDMSAALPPLTMQQLLADGSGITFDPNTGKAKPPKVGYEMPSFQFPPQDIPRPGMAAPDWLAMAPNPLRPSKDVDRRWSDQMFANISQETGWWMDDLERADQERKKAMEESLKEAQKAMAETQKEAEHFINTLAGGIERVLSQWRGGAKAMLQQLADEIEAVFIRRIATAIAEAVAKGMLEGLNSSGAGGGWGQYVGALLSFIPGVGPVAGAAVSGATSGGGGRGSLGGGGYDIGGGVVGQSFGMAGTVQQMRAE